MKRNKRYKDAVKLVDTKNLIEAKEAMDIVKTMSLEHIKAKFEESVEIAINLNLKARHTVRGTLTLPHQSEADNQAKKILVFAKADKASEALKAGATFVGDQDLIDKIKGGWTDFDVAIATPDMMRDVGKLGPILGRKGLMPNPKTGTVTMNIKAAVGEFKEGKTEYKADKAGIIHLKIGKISMDSTQLVDNASTLYKELIKKKPADLKGEYVRSIAFSSTMGPGVRIIHFSLN